MAAFRRPLYTSIWTAVVLCFGAAVTAQSVKDTGSSGSAKGRLVGAWHLVRIEAPGPDGKPVTSTPKGMLIYTADGHMSVQLMYPQSSNPISNEYVKEGYEASFGSYSVDESSGTVTHHVAGSNTGSRLVGKDLIRKFQFVSDERMIIRSTQTDEHWSVTWDHE